MSHTNALIIAGAILLRFLIFYNSDTFDQADNIPCISDTNTNDNDNQVQVQPIFITDNVTDTVIAINEHRHLWKCYFDYTYENMRMNFIEIAKKSKLKVYSYPLENYPDISTDVVIIDGSEFNSNIVVHISGTHGPEGYAGSAVQVSVYIW